MHQIALPALEAVIQLNRCEAPPPVPVVTTVAPVREHQSLYLVATAGCLYAVNAADGTARWCQQVQLIRTREYPPPPPWVSLPPPPRVTFCAPWVVNGVVYVCVDGFGEYTCAFNADDGSLRWWTPTDARVGSMPFMDWAVPLVKGGIVYSGTYALNAQDGTVLWRIAIDTYAEGALALHALTDETLFASTQRGIYAINAHNGQIRWLYQPDEQSIISGPPVVSGRLLYAGTRGSVWYPERSHFFALDVETGAETWRSPIRDYIGAVISNEWIYVSSGDRSLYALDTQSGLLRWRYQFGSRRPDPATMAVNVLYISADGAYALNSEEGVVLWHQPLESSRSVTFTSPVVLDGTVYLVRLDGHSRDVLYALDTRTGAECWHTPYPFGGARLAVAQ